MVSYLSATRWRPVPCVIHLMIYCFWFSPPPTCPHPPPAGHDMWLGCSSMIYCIWISSVLSECVDQPSVVCVPWSLVIHMTGTWNNSQDSNLSLAFSPEDGGVYYSQLFNCFTKVQIKLHWTLLNICHWAPMLKNRGFPEIENFIL